ncbi:MAG: hypothetical protein ACJAUV_000235 [Flavobacteriales bacterium]
MVGGKWMFGNNDDGDYENRISQEIQKHTFLKKKSFLAKKGNVFILHANLLHARKPVTNPDSNRKSMVLYYYTGDAICYHESMQCPKIKKNEARSKITYFIASF